MTNEEREKEIRKQPIPTKEECLAFYKELMKLADVRFVPYYKMAIKALEQQPKTGRWLDKKMTIKDGHGLAYGRYGCSVCKKKQLSKTDFCPNCGADMRGEKE